MRILIISLLPKWKEPPRLARALAEHGATVASLSVAGSLLEYSGFLKQRYSLHGESPERGGDLGNAIAAFRPDVLLPGDQLSVRWLHQLHADTTTSASLKSLIETSLGNPQWYECTSDKLAMSVQARELDILQPETIALTSNEDAHDFVHRHQWPVVIKACRGFAGFEVFPCGNLRDLRFVLRECSPDAPRLIQRFLDGVTWMVSFVARQGNLLGALVAEKQRQHPPLIGPSTIVRFAHDPAMLESTQRLVRHLGYSGFGSIDFLRTQDGDVYFIEFNPRATPICHLGGRLGIDLARAFMDGIACDDACVDVGQRVALFPQEIWRDPSGEGLADCWHDIPEDEPELVAAMRP